jgi:hypothetical protein
MVFFGGKRSGDHVAVLGNLSAMPDLLRVEYHQQANILEVQVCNQNARLRLSILGVPHFRIGLEEVHRSPGFRRHMVVQDLELSRAIMEYCISLPLLRSLLHFEH